MSRPVCAYIDTKAVVSNVKQLQSIAPEIKLFACVKANAYGHGAIECAQLLASHVAGFCVCSLQEAMALRQASITQPIVLLEGCFSRAETTQAIATKLELVVHNDLQVDWLLAQLNSRHETLIERVWVKMNTGMNRLGLSATDSKRVIQLCVKHTAIKRVVAMTHLHSADQDVASSEAQIARLKAVTKGLEVEQSWCNSAAFLQDRLRGGSYARLGIAIYGNAPVIANLHLQPVMRLTAAVIALYTIAPGQTVGYGATWCACKDTIVAIVACGYGDGYPRQCTSGTLVAVRGVQCPLIGRVSMDMLALDVSNVPAVAIGETVELWGTSVPADQVAEAANTISYHLFTGVTTRVPRIYI